MGGFGGHGSASGGLYGSGTPQNPWYDPNAGSGGTPGSGGPFPPMPGGYQPPPFQSTVEQDPNLQWQIDAYKNAMGTSDLAKQKQLIGQDVAESAAAQGRAISNFASRRGISDSGVEERQQQKNLADAERQKNRLFAEADLNDTKRRDSLLLGGQGIMAAPGQFQAGQGQNAFNNWLSTNQFYENKQNNAFNQLQAMLQMFKPQGGYAGNINTGGGQPMPNMPYQSVYDDPWFKSYLGSSGGGGGFGGR